MNIPKYMKMKLITVFTYFASSLFLNLVENKKIDKPKNKIPTIIPNSNTGVSSQITAIPDFVADVDTYAEKIEGEINKMPKRDQAAAYKIHAKWILRAKGAAKDYKNTLDSKEKELLELKFPIRVRRVMDRIESSFAEPSFCENCLQFGHKTTECQNPKAKKSRDAGANKLNRRAAYFEWVLREKGNTVEIAPLMAELKLAYNNHFLDGVENFEEYKKKFCHSLAVIHNIVDNKVHPEQVGKKLKNVNIFGKPLDSFALLLVKALDYSPDPDKPALEYED